LRQYASGEKEKNPSKKKRRKKLLTGLPPSSLSEKENTA